MCDSALLLFAEPVAAEMPAQMPAGLKPAWAASPLPTPPPRLPPDSLLKRYGANADLCGYKLSISGFNTDTDFWTCSASSTCMWNTDVHAVGCCAEGTCNFYTSCVESTALSGCGSACSANTLNLLCNDPVTQYCATATFDGDYFFYLCEPSPSWWWTVALTSPGQTAPPSGIPRFTGSNIVANISSTSLLTSNSSSFHTPTSSPSLAPNPISRNHKPRNVGAIAGGAVGGIAVLFLLVMALALLIRRDRRGRRATSDDLQLSTDDTAAAPAELPLSTPLPELPAQRKVELDGKQIAEMDVKPLESKEPELLNATHT
ncbi:MAG: hypothetical protein M1840_005240 [Geoglossum simile]|nr:MAG: hypothetical protein M1840_005240 [Geoglossum simile]